MAAIDKNPQETGQWTATLNAHIPAMLLVALPLSTFFMSRAAAALMVVTALVVTLLNYAVLPKLLRQTLAVFRHPLAATLLFLSSLAALSATWSLNLGEAVFLAGRVILTVILLVYLAAAFQQQTHPAERLAHVAFVALTIAAAFTCIAQLNLSELQKLFGWPVKDFHFNRQAVTLCFILPVAAYLNKDKPLLVMILCGLTAAAIFATQSESAKLAFIAAIITFAVSYGAPRLALIGFAIVAVSATLLMPYMLHLIAYLNAPFLSALLAQGHPDLRIQIWQQFMLLAGEKPLFGWGHEAGRYVFLDGAWQLPAELQLLTYGSHHPHNAFVQIWFEMGLMGAIILLTVLAAAIWTLSRVNAVARPYACAVAAAQLVVAAVSHGVWQNWWLALCGMTVLLLMVAIQAEKSNSSSNVSKP